MFVVIIFIFQGSAIFKQAVVVFLRHLLCDGGMRNHFWVVISTILLAVGGANVVNEAVDFEKNSSRSEAIIDVRF